MCWREPRTAEELTPAQREVLGLDEALVRVARSLGAFDLALGVTLGRLFEGDRLAQLSYAREADYARERLGLPPSSMFQCVRLARELKSRPLLREAVAAGMVSTRKALAVLPLAVGDLEAGWTEAASRISLREIEGAVKAAGKESPEERFEAEAILLPMTAGQQARFDAGLAWAKRSIGPEARRWQCTEAMCQEFLSSFAEWDGGGLRGQGEASAPPPLAPRAAKLVTRQLAAVDEALDVIRGIEEASPGSDALGLDARARRLVLARRRYDETFGILANRIQWRLTLEVLGYRSFEEYCDERLGARAGTVRQRTWLERRMRDLPALRQAMRSGRLTYSKALAVARHATPFDIEDRIARAEATTCQQTEREADAEEERKNRGAGARRLWGPKDAVRTVRDAIAAAQARSLAERGVAIDAGEALAVIADHFVEVCEAHTPTNRRPWVSRFRREVLQRTGGLCAVPGCSRAAVHVHHIVFRSHGGKDTKENGVGVCAVHHLHGIHLGYLEVTGRAGERLHWKFAAGEAVPTEEWATYGKDDVRRAETVAEGCEDADRGWLLTCDSDSRGKEVVAAA